MKYALFLGCNIPARVPQYETATRAVLEKLSVEIADIKEFACCGYPARNTDEMTFLVSAAKNLALAEKSGLDMLVLCKCCFGSLKHAQHDLQDETKKKQVNDTLAKVGLEYQGAAKVSHLLSVLHKDVGVKAIKEKITTPFKKLSIATHYGCHALRPSEVTEFDDPVAPVIFDDLVKVTGATSASWPDRLECCGAPLFGTNDLLSTKLTQKKLASAKNAGADYLCTGCPYCQLQFDSVQQMMVAESGESALPSLVYPQLLGLSLGIDDKTLGLEHNQLDIRKITSFLEEKSEE